MTSPRTLGIIPAVLLSVVATGSAQVCGVARPIGPCNPYAQSWGAAPVPYYGYGAPYCGPATPYQRSFYDDNIDTHFKRRLKNIDYRYKIYPALVRARLDRDRELAEIKQEYATTITYNQRQTASREQRRLPKRLTEFEYDPVTGVVYWPPLLQDDERFATYRMQIDALFAQGDSRHGPGESVSCIEVKEATDQMRGILRKMLRSHEVDGTTYAATKTFLESLAYEAQGPAAPGVEDLAADCSCDAGVTTASLPSTDRMADAHSERIVAAEASRGSRPVAGATPDLVLAILAVPMTMLRSVPPADPPAASQVASTGPTLAPPAGLVSRSAEQDARRPLPELLARQTRVD